MATKTKIRIAALGDIHMGKLPKKDTDALFAEIGKQADVLALCGDLTDHGSIDEALQLANFLKACQIPKVAVLGNHDYARGEEKEITQILRENNINVLQDNVFVYEEYGFAGVKGFGGGYGPHTVGAFGEKPIKQFVQEAINEAEQLEVLLEDIRAYEKKVVLFHYSPIPGTNKGESEEIFPFLGTSRLEEVVDRYEVTVVFHGHAHYGSLQGKTLKGIDVYNVAFPLMQKFYPKKPYRIIEL